MLSLLAWLFGPIFAKELVEVGRRRRTYITRTIYGIALLTIVSLIWMSRQQYPYGYEGTTISEMASEARDLFEAVCCEQFFGVLLLTPAIVCGLIAGEREAHTLDTLLSSPLSNSQIIFGKFASRAAVVLCLVLGGVPVLALLSLFGGIDLTSIGLVALVTVLGFLFTGSVSLCISSRTSSVMGAMILSYLILATYILVVPFLVVIIVEMGGISSSLGDTATGAIILINPMFTFFASCFENAHYEFARYAGPNFLFWSYVTPLTLAAVSLLISFGSLRRTERTRRAKRTVWFPYWRRRLGESLHSSGRINPLVLRGLQSQPYGGRGILRLSVGTLTAMTVLAMLLTYLLNLNGGGDEVRVVILCAVWLVTGIITTMIAATSIARDRRRGFFEHVLLTPLTVREMVDGGYGAVLAHLHSVWALSSLVSLALVINLDISFASGFILLAINFAFGALLVAFGVACSFTASIPQQALIPTLIFASSVVIGPFLLDGLYLSIIFAWFFTAIAIPVAVWVVRRRLNATTAGVYHGVVYLTLISLAVGWVRTLGGWIYHRANAS